MTLAQLRTALQARGYGTDTATVQTECINAAYRKVCGDTRWEWLVETALATALTPGVQLISGLPADVVHLKTLLFTFDDVDYYPEYLPIDQFQRLSTQYGWLPNEGRGVPQYWTRRGWLSGAPELIVGPYPDQAYVPVLVYVKDPADLSADGDIPAMPPTYHDILVDGALAEMGARHRDWAMHDRYKAEFNHGVARMRAQLGLDQQQTSEQVRKSGFFDEPARWPDW